MNILISIGGLAFLVLIHEAGHFVTALAVRMRPRKFYVFLPPAIVKTTRNGIEYGLGAIPLGGYVKIPGMHRPAVGDVDHYFARAIDAAPWLARSVAGLRAPLERGDLEAARAALPDVRAAVARADLSEAAQRSAEKGLTDIDDGLSSEAYWRAPVWKRIAVISAGPAANLLFAVGMLAVVFALGVQTGATRTVDEVRAASPAERIGLQPGDVIVAVDGQPTAQFEDVSERIRGSNGREITLTVERGGENVELKPARPELMDGSYRIGFVPEASYTEYGPGAAIVEAFQQTGEVTVAIGKSLGGIVTGETRDDVSGIVGIVDQSSQVVEAGFRYYLGVLALISLSLALLNLLPLLPLDGGHIAFSIAEKLRGRAIPREAYERASMIGIALVGLLIILGLFNDVGRLRGG